MKTSAKILLVLLLAGPLSVPLWSQNDEIKVRIETVEDGQKKVFERTYTTKEEIRSDAELKAWGFEGEEAHDIETMVFSKSLGDDSKQITIDVDEETDGKKIKVKKVMRDRSGKETVIEREYLDEEEMEADKDMEMHIIKKLKDQKRSGDEEEILIRIEKDKEETDGKITKKVIIEIEEEGKDNSAKKKKKVKVIEEKDDRR